MRVYDSGEVGISFVVLLVVPTPPWDSWPLGITEHELASGVSLAPKGQEATSTLG